MNFVQDKLTKKFYNSIQSILNLIELDSINDILDSRDSELFSNLWINAWNKIGDEKLNLEKERENIFKLILSTTKSSDLSAYITEDFELIANYLILDENNWVTSLCESYFNGKIPRGKLDISNNKLVELINQ